MNARVSLEQIAVSNPCPADWNEMPGDRKGRFCQHCQKTVHNLSAMSRNEAERLVCQAAGSLCVRYAVAPDGRVMTLDYPSAAGPEKWSWKVWAVVGLCGALVTGVVNAAFFGTRVFPRPAGQVVGEIAPWRLAMRGPVGSSMIQGDVLVTPGGNFEVSPQEWGVPGE